VSVAKNKKAKALLRVPPGQIPEKIWNDAFNKHILFIAVGFSQRIKKGTVKGFSRIIILAKARFPRLFIPSAKADGNE
jgi:hypothetical protein